MKKLLRIMTIVVVLGGLAAGAVWGYNVFGKTQTVIRYQTEKAARADLAATVSATGTLEPEELVNVGAQVSGKIVSFGKDANGNNIDYGSPVKAGMVLARIDDAIYDAEKRSANAQKLQAGAAILSARANIRQSEAKQTYANSNWERAKDLYPKKAMAKSEYDKAQSEILAAEASKLVSEAELEHATAQLAYSEAAYDKAARNLDYCTINSPVDGVIIDRRVSIGQTVVSNMSASSIFLIAKDLKRMQVWVSVNEADVGSIVPGMAATFSVDAFPDKIFRGTVHKIRLNATMSQNVVTYVVEVATDNSNGKLLPYLTASVKFIKESRKQVLAIPNAALRFRPDPARLLPEYHAVAAEKASGNSERTIWINTSEGPCPVKVKTGLNDGILTEIVAGELQEGMDVITGSATVAAVSGTKSSGNSGSPFIPKPRKRH